MLEKRKGKVRERRGKEKKETKRAYLPIKLPL